MAGADPRRTVRYGIPQALLFLEVAGDAHDVLVGTRVALLGDLLPDPRGVATALVPPLEDVVFVGCDGADLLREVTSLGRGLEGQILLHRVAMYPEGPSDPGVLHAFLRKAVDGAEELVCLLSRAFLRSSAVQAQVRQPLEMYGRSRNEVQDLGMLPEYPEDYVPQVLQEMEAV